MIAPNPSRKHHTPPCEGYRGVHPPSTVSVGPVTKRDAPEARKTAAPPSSSTLPTRPYGVLSTMRSPQRPAGSPEPRSDWQ